MAEPDFLRPAQLAALLHVSPKTVARWITEGKIRHQRTLGGEHSRGHARISLAEADRLVELMFQRGSGPPEAQEDSP